ncbi:MAG: glycoside hydrolase family 3 C-terminal domain-containing protein [Rikenellaceae bacterium]
MRLLTCLTLLFSVGVASASAEELPIWKDSSKSFDERVEDLLPRLTIEEKLRYFSSDIPASESLGIPSFMWYAEALHGVLTYGCTSFPQNNAMGSTWDRDLLFDVANAISDEVRALHSAGRSQVMIYSPTVNMARDPRWGRNEECYSEDPYQMSEMAKMYIRGMQGTHPKYLKTVCTVKHYVANNVEHKREQIHSMIDERDLREYYFPAYKACIVDERAAGVMSALNGLNGTSCSEDKWLLSTVLREEWGFEGYLVADWGGVGAICTYRKDALSLEEAAVRALRAGCDQECFRPRESPMVKGLIEAYKNGVITEAELDVPLRRLLKLRFMVNGFWLDDECPYNNTPMSLVESDEHRALALKAAEKSIVLLKNENDILPLKSDVKSIAVVGPFADRCWLGIYSGKPSETISPLQGIKAKFDGEVLYEAGCGVTEADDDIDMSKAIAIASKADVVVAFVGNDNTTSTENNDRETLALPGRQQELLDKLCKANKNVVVVIVPSGPTTIGDAQQNADGVICGWANGQEQGTAIAKVLFGETNPGGKLSTTWFASDSDLPDLHDYNVRNNRTYMYFGGEPLYPFGYGLSYTTFKISNLKLNKSKLKEGGDMSVTVDVTNTGKVAGDEVIQLYIKDNASKSVEAKKMLRGFERVTLKSGETKRITMTLTYDNFSHWSIEKEAFVVSKGSYDIMVGNSSVNTPLMKSVKVEGGTLPEHSLHTVDHKDCDADPRYRSTYYGGKIIAPEVKAEQPATKSVGGPHWTEYMVNFVDPGFYVSEWTINVNYTATTAATAVKVEYDGVVVVKDATFEKAGKATQAVVVPKPEYGLPTRVRFVVKDGVDIESIDVIWPKDNSKINYNIPVSVK